MSNENYEFLKGFIGENGEGTNQAGYEMELLENGDIVTYLPDGSQEIMHPDGSWDNEGCEDCDDEESDEGCEDCDD
jgi:hypothetical protein